MDREKNIININNTNNNKNENIKNNKSKKLYIVLSIIVFTIGILILLIVGIYYSKNRISQNTILKKHDFLNNMIQFQSYTQPQLYIKTNLTSIDYSGYNRTSNNYLKLLDTNNIDFKQQDSKNQNLSTITLTSSSASMNQLFSIQTSTFEKNKILIQSLSSLLYCKLNNEINRIELVQSDNSNQCLYFTLIEANVLGCSNCFNIRTCENTWVKFTNSNQNSPIETTINIDDPLVIIKISVFKS